MSSGPQKSAGLGFDADDAEDAVAMEMELLNNGQAPTAAANGGKGNGKGNKTDKFSVRVFINMDEDDDGSKGIKPNDIFERENTNIPYYVDVSTKIRFFKLK